jgi:toxin-antitoxin system PIN domain toxin
LRALLDVNVLIALHDRQHGHHHTVSHWFQLHAEQGWASCPLTQNGCVRILSQANYTNPVPLRDAITMLHRSCSTRYHTFWPDDVSLLDPGQFHHAHLHGHRQLTDAYLLALAVKHAGRLVTLDGHLALSTVYGAQKKHLVAL